MSTLKRSGDVLIIFKQFHRIIQCPFALGPLELKVSKTVGEGVNKKTKSAKATTDIMLGYMDLKIDSETGHAEITDVVFDEPGGISVQGNIKRRAQEKEGNREKSKYK